MQQLQGYDPVAKKLVAFGFSGDGNFQIQTIKVDGMKKGMTAAKGVGGDWELKVFAADGTTKTNISKWEFTQLEKDKVVMTWSKVEGNDPDQPNRLTMTLERKKRKERK